ncbi:MAG: phosphatase, partial [Chthonomonadales bacterium]|nr:phosphatase [Chthonomonadales bacterium]
PFDLETDTDSTDDIESLLKPGREIIVEVTANDQAKAIIRQPLQGRSTLAIGSQRQFVGESFPNVPDLVWLGTNRAEVWSHARRYSQLYRSGGAEILLSLLREIEPRLRSLVVLTMERSGAISPTAVLEADLGFDRTLPLDSMGDGFSNVISILSAIGAAPNGLCLIDEVDNGIHYSLLPQAWRSVVSAAHIYDSQVWATTHSYDCISAIHEALIETPDALRVHRLERRTDGEVIIHTFDHAMLGRALESGLEVR